MLWTNGVSTFAEYLEATKAYTLEGLVERKREGGLLKHSLSLPMVSGCFDDIEP
jgi:hypothetical protein